MVTELLLPRGKIPRPIPPSYLKLDTAFGVGAGPALGDKSRYRTHGAIVDATWSALGLHGYCLDFDGDDYVDLGHPDALDVVSAFTIMGWINTDAAAVNQSIYASRAGVSPRRIWLRSNGFSIGLPVAGFTELAWASVSADWHHLAGSYNGAQIEAWIDGVSQGVAPIAGDMDVATANWIGGHPDDIWYTTGRISHVRLYGIALTESEIQAHYNATR